MKRKCLRLSFSERGLVLFLLKRELKFCIHDPLRSQNLGRLITQVNVLPARTKLFSRIRYFDWFYSDADSHIILKEIAAGRNRDIRLNEPHGDADRLFMKLTKAKYKTVPAKQRDACK